MQANKLKPVGKKDLNSPYSDFEISYSSAMVGDKKKVSKGRFLYWGKVKSNDCPA